MRTWLQHFNATGKPFLGGCLTHKDSSWRSLHSHCLKGSSKAYSPRCKPSSRVLWPMGCCAPLMMAAMVTGCQSVTLETEMRWRGQRPSTRLPITPPRSVFKKIQYIYIYILARLLYICTLDLTMPPKVSWKNWSVRPPLEDRVHFLSKFLGSFVWGSSVKLFRIHISRCRKMSG